MQNFLVNFIITPDDIFLNRGNTKITHDDTKITHDDHTKFSREFQHHSRQ